MDESCIYETQEIERLFDSGKQSEAFAALDKELTLGGENYSLLCLRGRLLGQCGRWGESLDSYLRPAKLRPGSSAAAQAEMIAGILDFRNKDLYNQ